MAIKISSSIELVINRSAGAPEKYPWAKMKVGDSFAWPDGVTSGAIYAANVRYAPKKFSWRKYGDGYRVWRIK